MDVRARQSFSCVPVARSICAEIKLVINACAHCVCVVYTLLAICFRRVWLFALFCFVLGFAFPFRAYSCSLVITYLHSVGYVLNSGCLALAALIAPTARFFFFHHETGTHIAHRERVRIILRRQPSMEGFCSISCAETHNAHYRLLSANNKLMFVARRES